MLYRLKKNTGSLLRSGQIQRRIDNEDAFKILFGKLFYFDRVHVVFHDPV